MNLSRGWAMEHIELLHQRYAKALFDFASKNSETDKMMQDLETLTRIVRSNNEISQVLRHPEIGKEEKLSVLKKISEKEKFCEALMDFLKVLTKKGRLSLIHGILLRYRDYYDSKRKKTKVFVKSAIKLKKEQIDKLLKHLRQCLKEEVVLDIKVDPSLIGGLFIKSHDRIYDASVIGMLHDMNKKLAGAG